MKVGIIGAGSFGTALLQIYSKVFTCIIWDRDPNIIENLNSVTRNPRYFPEIQLEGNFSATNSLDDLNETDYLFVAIPSSVITEIGLEKILKDKIVLSTCKGLTKEGNLVSDYLKKFSKEVYVLSGPTFAIDLIKLSPVAAVLASEDLLKAYKVAEIFSNKFIKLYPSKDLIGTQLAGILKNIYAIASGYAYGAGFGVSSIFSLLTRAVAELSSLIELFGGDRLTAFGLAGAGDLFMTGSSEKSRNFRFGVLLGKGMKASIAVNSINQTIEGYTSLQTIESFLKDLSKAPILIAIKDLINDSFSGEKISGLIQRPIKEEFK